MRPTALGACRCGARGEPGEKPRDGSTGVDSRPGVHCIDSSWRSSRRGFECSYSRVHTLLTRQPRRGATIGVESEDVVEISEEDLAAFNSLVQDGLIEVVTIEDGMPYYRIASEFAGPLEPTTGPGR